VLLFHEAAGEFPKLASARELLITALALICDVFWSERCDGRVPWKQSTIGSVGVIGVTV
jgi:hypothetical protein